MRTFLLKARAFILATVSGALAGIVAFGCMEGAWMTLTLDRDISPQISTWVSWGNGGTGAFTFVIVAAIVFDLAWPRRTKQTKERALHYS
ncbi:MAG: hypothetical protein WC030_00570 [Candidatus Paceibacterota bacterium]